MWFRQFLGALNFSGFFNLFSPYFCLNAVITSVVKNSKRRSAIFTGNEIICIQMVILVVASFMNHRVSPRESVRLLNEISKYIRMSGRTAVAWSRRMSSRGWMNRGSQVKGAKRDKINSNPALGCPESQITSHRYIHWGSSLFDADQPLTLATCHPFTYPMSTTTVTWSRFDFKRHTQFIVLTIASIHDHWNVKVFFRIIACSQRKYLFNLSLSSFYIIVSNLFCKNDAVCINSFRFSL